MIFNEKFECMPLADLKNIQSERLCRLVSYVYENNDVYRAHLESHGVGPDDIKTIDDIVKLPFTTKEAMRDNYPFKLFARPIGDIREIHVSSGTTGNPTVVGYTDEDVDLWGEVMARCLGCAGAKPGDMVQNAYGYGLFTGGLGVHYGALKMKCTILPMSAGGTARQLKLMQDFRPRVLTCTPSYAIYMVEDAVKMGMDPRKSSWQVGLHGAEPWTQAMRVKIEESWDMLATDIYGLSEIIGPGVAQECERKDGLHIFSDVFYPEIIDPNADTQVAEGEYGELVITTLTKTGVPLIRYRTRDIVCMTSAECACGRTSPRISKVRGRTDDMIIVRGINVFPSQIEHVLLSVEGVQPHYQLVVDRKEGGLDTLEVMVEVDEKIFSDEVKQLTAFEHKLEKQIADVLTVSAKVRLVEANTIERSIGKAKRVVDKRSLS
jgi:phenylacetate-CoA ligase